MTKELIRIAVTNRHLCDVSLGEQVRCLAQSKELRPDLLILREKDLGEGEYEALAKEILPLCEEGNIRCILHTYGNVARSLGVKALHLPMPLWKECMAEVSDFTTLGVSVHSVEEARFAQKHGASYITAGHVFSTDCKKGMAPRGLDFLREVCAAVTIPVYAIGGIGPDNIPLVQKKCGSVAGVCMMSYYMKFK